MEDMVLKSNIRSALSSVKIKLFICDKGRVCGLCGFFVPSLPDMIFGPDGNLWKEKK